MRGTYFLNANRRRAEAWRWAGEWVLTPLRCLTSQMPVLGRMFPVPRFKFPVETSRELDPESRRFRRLPRRPRATRHSEKPRISCSFPAYSDSRAKETGSLRTGPSARSEISWTAHKRPGKQGHSLLSAPKPDREHHYDSDEQRDEHDQSNGAPIHCNLIAIVV